MTVESISRALRLTGCATAAGGAIALSACGQIGYYAQSINGHFTVLHEAHPVSELLADPALNPRLRARLIDAEQMRAYAVSALGLPDNGSYRSYADLKRPFVVYNVFAAPALSLKLHESCLLVVGCVEYRGYYSRESAEAYAADLHRDGWETFVAGIPAYSTLGYFDDPLLNTFIYLPRGELARMIFHELAHQVLYVRGDTTFNESFAVTVESVGVQRWIDAHPDAAPEYAQYSTQRKQFRGLVEGYRKRLQAVYEGAGDDSRKAAEKMRLFSAMRDDYQQLRAQWGGYAGFDRWFASDLNNAKIGAFATYNQWVPAFAALLAQEGGDLPSFYRAVKALSKRPESERNAVLAQLSRTPAAMAVRDRDLETPGEGRADVLVPPAPVGQSRRAP
ncbi:aminopeptidase [Pandoraea terrae]|uniref:Aminopeptidase n=1 Tax=Pandoraea terrae TaxID=1537710 RepID=A0A5E4YQL9_9BURK|nr:aminopeptidase [Pandoraea terrae]VVE50540.1 aminopeptidase [Pandoraea terrae]